MMLCIPGDWLNLDEFIAALAATSKMEYMPISGLLLNSTRKTSFNYEFHDYDGKMKSAFEYAGLATRMSESDVNKVSEHKNVVFLYGPIGGLAEAYEIALAGAAILQAGGIAIKIETAGKAFSKQTWYSMIENFEPLNIYKMFVVDTITNSSGATYSCGMKNLGLRDFIVLGEDFQNAVDLISLIAENQIIHHTIFKDKEEISLDAGREVYTIRTQKNQPYDDRTLFKNPFGMWQLQRL